jgi:hypothetical protein
VVFCRGKVGLVRKVLRAGILQNSRIEKDLGAIYTTESSFGIKIGYFTAILSQNHFLLCICPAKVRDLETI